MKTPKWLKEVSFWLLGIGGINWGLVGLFNFNLVEWIFGMGIWSTVIYILVGLSAVTYIYAAKFK